MKVVVTVRPAVVVKLTEPGASKIYIRDGRPGPEGPQGPQGPPGATGPEGEPGQDGADGKSAYEIAVDNGYTGTVTEWLNEMIRHGGNSRGEAIVIGTNDAFALNFETSGTVRAVIDATGRVGVGITNISAYLGNRFVLNAAADENGMTIMAHAISATNYIYFADGNSGTARMAGFIGYSHSADQLIFGSGTTARMYVNASGNVGIGSGTTVVAKLQIGTTAGANGGDIYSMNAAADARFLFGQNTNAGSWGGLIWNRAGNQLRIVNSGFSGTEGIQLFPDGNVAIGTTTNSVTYKFEIAGSVRFSQNLVLGVQNSGVGASLTVHSTTGNPTFVFDGVQGTIRSRSGFTAWIPYDPGNAGMYYNIAHNTVGFARWSKGATNTMTSTLQLMYLTRFGQLLLDDSTPAGNNTPSDGAILELKSTTRMLVPPFMTGAQAEAIATKPEAGMIYATNGNGSVITSKGWWGWNGTTFEKFN